jgi:hypothetical protein
MRLLSGHLVGIALACALGGFALPADAGAAPVIGVNAGSVFERPDVDSQLGAMRKLGIREVRADVSWTDALWGSWDRTDRIVQKLDSRGLRWYPILDAYGQPREAAAQPPDPALYAQAARDFALRYRGRIESVELWNEPNYRTFWTGTPQQYAEMFRRASRAIKAVAPEIRVVVGGLANLRGWEAWLLRAGLTDFDAIALHPYRGDPGAQVRRLRRLTGAQVDVTEFGIPRGSMLGRRSYMRRVTRSLMQSGAKRVMAFVWTGGGKISRYRLVGPRGLLPHGVEYARGARRASR